MNSNSISNDNTSDNNEEATSPLFYLPLEQWSPRYGSHIFTTKIDSRQIVSDCRSIEATNTNPTTYSIGGRRTLPACYYKVQLIFGHSTMVLLRRYSQFRWLYELIKEPSFSNDSATLPFLASSSSLTDEPASTSASAKSGKSFHLQEQTIFPNHYDRHDLQNSDLRFPPKLSPFFQCCRMEEVQESRQDALNNFVRELLKRPGYISKQEGVN